MDILNSLLNDKYSDMFESLLNSGFSEYQAKDFIPEAIPHLLTSINKKHSDNSYTLGYADIDGLATKLDINSYLVSTGLQKLLPIVLVVKNGSSAGVKGLAKKFFSFL